MSLDSTAQLLFNIGANSDDATGNMQAFRTLLSKDLSDLGAEFDAWSTKVFGDMSTVQGAMIAGGAAIGVALVAAGAAAVHCADQYAEYVEGVAKASKITGIAVEDMSRLKFAAEMTGTNFDSLTQGLAKFTATMVKGADGSQQQAAAFARLGITQEQLKAGESNMMPLLEELADKFANLKNKTDRTTEARDLFGRSGTQFLSFLALGKDGLKEFGDQAARMGLIVGHDDVEALHQYQAALAQTKAVQEAVDMQVGQKTLPALSNLKMAWGSLIETMVQGGGWVAFVTNFAEMKAGADRVAEALGKIGQQTLAPVADAPKIEKAKEAWHGLSDVLEQVRGKLAATISEEAKAGQEIAKLWSETRQKMDDLTAKHDKGDLKDGVFEQQLADADQILKLIPELYQRMLADIATKRRIAGEEAHAELMHRLESEQVQTQAVRESAWNYEIDKLRAGYEQKKQLTAANEEIIAQIRAAGLDKIARDEAEKLAKFLEGLAKEATAARAAEFEKQAQQQARFDGQMASLAGHLEKIRSTHQTAAERIAATYQDDVAKYTAAEEKKALVAAATEQQRTAIAAQYAAIRAALLIKEGQDLQALRNSQGWQGVFGSQFATLIKGNEALMKEWASSTNQSMMMVRVSMEGLREEGQKAFEQLAQGMGQNIANAFIYKKSIGEAMRAALASTLESLAAESLTWAIYSTALGFTRLAQHDAAGASSAFTAAAIWGSVGAAAAVAGRLVAPPQAGAAATAGGAGASGASAAASASTAAVGQGGPKVTVNVWGHIIGVSGIQEVAAALNDAVLNQDVTLTATNTKGGQQVTR